MMKKVFTVYVILAAILACVAFMIINLRLDSVLIEGSEQVYYGTVVDQAAAQTGYKRESRGYLGIEFENGEGICVWEPKMRERWHDISLGDQVKVDTAVEKRSGLLVALEVEVLP